MLPETAPTSRPDPYRLVGQVVEIRCACCGETSREHRGLFGPPRLCGGCQDRDNSIRQDCERDVYRPEPREWED